MDLFRHENCEGVDWTVMQEVEWFGMEIGRDGRSWMTKRAEYCNKHDCYQKFQVDLDEKKVKVSDEEMIPVATSSGHDLKRDHLHSVQASIYREDDC